MVTITRKRRRWVVAAGPLHELLGIKDRPEEPTYPLEKASKMLGRGAAWGRQAAAAGVFPVPLIELPSPDGRTERE
jgi:hypothetical protein